MKASLTTILALAVVCMSTQSHAQGTPLKLVVPAPAGGGSDGFFRRVAHEAEATLGVPVVVMNVGGAGGTVGVTQVLNAHPDGKTLAAVWSSPITAVPHAMKQSYKPDDFTPIIQVSTAPYVFCVASSFPAATGPELIAQLKQNPGKYTYGNDGIGGTGHLASERIFRASGVEVRDIPFKGAGDTLNNFLGGHVDIYVGSISTIAAHVKSGKVRCPLISAAARIPSFPSASGLEEIGLAKEETLLWRGFIGPKNMPADRVAELERGLEAAVKTESVRKFMEEAGEQLVIRKGPELRQMIADEYGSLGRIATALNLKK